MDKKQLAIQLSKLKVLEEFDVSLEQYQIDSNLASELLWGAFMNGDIEGKLVADLGCGSGFLGVGALLLGAKHVSFADIDEKALDICLDNLDGFSNYSLVKGDISLFDARIDTVIMNPPFGVQEKYADRRFLEKAFDVSNAIYSLHTLDSEKFLRSFCEKHGFSLVFVKPLKFLVKRTYAFHSKENHSVDVGLFHFKKS